MFFHARTSTHGPTRAFETTNTNTSTNTMAPAGYVAVSGVEHEPDNKPMASTASTNTVVTPDATPVGSLGVVMCPARAGLRGPDFKVHRGE